MPLSDTDDLAALVVDFLNTLDVEDHSDVLDRPYAWTAWTRERGLEPGDAGRARAARTALRDLLGGAEIALPPASLTVRVDRGEVVLVATDPGDPTGAVLAAVATLTARGGLHRLKLCVADTCRWAYYDRSKNQSRTWCSMEVCGNRAKSRTSRAKVRGGAVQTS